MIHEAKTQSPPSASETTTEGLPLGARIVTLLGVILPFLGLAAAITLAWGWGFSWLHLGLLIGMYVGTALGITVGYHRLFTHRSFETTRPVKFIFAVLGSMAVEGPVLKWVAMHRRHHQHSDEENDPHSPHHHGEGIRGVLAGFWHAHLGWIFDRDPANLSRYVADLLADRPVRVVSKTWTLWSAIGLLIPSVLGGLITMSWKGALTAYIWAGLVRVGFVHHITWAVNSVCHVMGERPFKTGDKATNVWWLAILSMGES